MSAPDGHPNLTRAGAGNPNFVKVPDDQRRVGVSLTLSPDLLSAIDASALPEEVRPSGRVNRSRVIERLTRAGLNATGRVDG